MDATIQQIADENGVSRATAGRVLKSAKELGTHEHLPRGGSKEKLSERDKRILLRTKKQRHQSTPLKAIVKQEQLSIGATTLRKVLKEDGYEFKKNKKVK